MDNCLVIMCHSCCINPLQLNKIVHKEKGCADVPFKSISQISIKVNFSSYYLKGNGRLCLKYVFSNVTSLVGKA